MNILVEKFRYLRELLYNKRVCSKIGVVGSGSVIVRPCQLQGSNLKDIHIGHNTRIQSHSVLECWGQFGDQVFNPTVIIGNNCKIGEYFHLTSCNRIVIGDGFLTGRFVLITDNSHGHLSMDNYNIPPSQRPLESKGEIVIGKNVWIGDKVTILAGVTIGDNVIIGANSVVTTSIPSNSMAAGIPAVIMKQVSN